MQAAWAGGSPGSVDDHGAQAAADLPQGVPADARRRTDTTAGREARPEAAVLPARDVDALEGYLKALPRNDAAKPLATLIEISQNPVRVVKTAQDGGAFVSYEIAVPSELKRIAVLDASWPIRRLEQLDRHVGGKPGI